MVKKILTAMSFVVLVSCVSLVGPGIIPRWGEDSPEIVSSDYVVNRGHNIFDDYLWSSPKVNSVEVKLENTFHIKKLEYNFEIADSSINVKNSVGEIVSTSVRKKSNNNFYYNIQDLKLKSETRNRWVAKTTIEHETVPVHKSRQVPRTNFNADGTTSTTYETEFYVDYEIRYVPKTNWVWEQYWTKVLDIPKYSYYDFEIDDDVYILYEITNGNSKKYYLQNASYLYLDLKEDNEFGYSDLKIIFIDSNANGDYFDSSDRVFFNSWNPFNINSEYKSVKGFIENRWYNLSYVYKNNHISFSLSGDSVLINNINNEYIGVLDTGILNIIDAPLNNSKLYLNGTGYDLIDLFGNPRNKFTCEYGKYYLRITSPGYEDFESIFEINSENPNVEVKYYVTKETATLSINNIFSDNYSVVITSEKGEELLYNNQSVISVPSGKNIIEIYYDGFIFRKELEAKNGEQIQLDFEKEIQQ